MRGGRKGGDIRATLFAALFIVVVVICGCGPDWLDDYNKGVEYQQAGKIDLAELQFKLASQRDPELAEAYLNLGLIQMNRGWLDGGENSTKKAIEIFERTRRTVIKGYTLEQALSLAYNNLGVVEMQRALAAEIKSDKRDAKAHWENGIFYFKKAIELDPMDSLAQSNVERFKNAYSE